MLSCRMQKILLPI
jgi:hypothetical protein